MDGESRITRVNQGQRTSRRKLKELAATLRSGIFLGRLLLGLTGLLLVLMPWSEHMWSWDRFFHGGQDVEFGLLTIAAVLCLALLLSQRCLQLTPLTLLGAHARARALRSRWDIPNGLRPHTGSKACRHSTLLQI